MVRLPGLVVLALSLSLPSSPVLALPTAAPTAGASSLSTAAAAGDVLTRSSGREVARRDGEKTSESLERRAAGASYYSSLVAFGASYTDNAHARAPQYAGSLRQYEPYSKYGGRYSNGPVAVEYMVKTSTKPALPQNGKGVKLLDYAYGGSVVQNGLTGTGSQWPATQDQVTSFLSDLKNGKAAVGSGRTLFYFNSGINPVAQIWKAALSSGLSSSALSLAQSAVTANTAALSSYARSISYDPSVAAKTNGADFLIVGIPQLDLVPAMQALAPPGQQPQALAALKALADQYNEELKTFVTAFQGEVNGGNALWFDLAGLWSSMTNSPSLYGITAGTKPCYSSSNGKVCKNPNQFLYFDTLHPVTTVHQLMAEKMNGVVAGNPAPGATPTALAQKGLSSATAVGSDAAATTLSGSTGTSTPLPTQIASSASFLTAPTLSFTLALSLASLMTYLSIC
ncbi:GDSL esterase/lipase [Rhodotorula toruloides]|nr:GDSL esterase/lipase [Rhodotorula toruloides]